jgi:hypothetical protein
MKEKLHLTTAGMLIVGGLITATIGVVIQIISGVPYPKVPPVFFIQLIPAGLVIFGKWRWTPLVVIIGSVFLTIGLFTSGASVRLTDFHNTGGSVGLWIQTFGNLVALFAGVAAMTRRYSLKTA